MLRMLVLAMLALPVVGMAADSVPTLYERVDARFEADPSLAKRMAGKPVELESFAWMEGDWKVDVEVFATATTPRNSAHGRSHVERDLGGRWLRIVDTYPEGGTDLGFLTYDVARETWVSVGMHEAGAAVTALASGWRGDSIVFNADDAVIVGEQVTLRQTLTRRGADDYEIVNEERLPSGRWVKLDRYEYRRVAQP